MGATDDFYRLLDMLARTSTWDQNEIAAAGRSAVGLVVPAPSPAGLTGFKLVDNLTFGARGNIRNRADLVDKVEFLDSFGQKRGGGNHYGADTIAETTASANVGQSQAAVGNGNTRWMREFTGTSMLMHVRAKSAAATTIGPPSAVDCYASSFMHKYQLPAMGRRLGKDVVWEVDLRVSTPASGSIKNGLWAALWIAGTQWNNGPEIDLMEAYTTSILDNFRVMHSDVIGGTSNWNMTTDFWAGMAHGVPVYNQHDLRNWHKFTLVYRKDDTWATYLDGAEINAGTLDWRYNGVSTPNCRFMIDWSWGNTQVGDLVAVTETITANAIVGTMEIASSRIWMRD